MTEDWPWDQSPNCGVFTLKSIVFEGGPILHVTHDLDDHGWQFLGREPVDAESAALVSLEELSKLDPTVLDVAHIAPGWHAWRRNKKDPWTIEPNPNDEG